MNRRDRLPVATLMTASALIGGAVYYSAPANAITNTSTVTITVSVGWDGGDCISMVEPDPGTGRRTTVATLSCDPAQGLAIQYVAQSGDWIGVDPIEQRGVALACQVEANGVIVMESAGFAGVSCLGRW